MAELTAPKCPDEVEALIGHLKESGTGKGKLERIRALGCECKTAAEFLEKLPTIVPPGTIQKVKDLIKEAQTGDSFKVLAKKTNDKDESHKGDSSTPHKAVGVVPDLNQENHDVEVVGNSTSDLDAVSEESGKRVSQKSKK